MNRADLWRSKLIGQDPSEKRDLYYKFIQHRTDVSPSILTTIQADMPRTYPGNKWVTVHSARIQNLLVSYAAVHKGDSYLQGFNYFMTMLLYVYQHTEHAEADSWWCFARIVGLIRPLMPDFNVAWFHWMRKHWIGELYHKLNKRPRFQAILFNELDSFSSLVTVRWFMIWFAQTVVFSDLPLLWDFLIEQPPKNLMRIYTFLTYEILEEAAPTITYEWSKNPSELLFSILSMKVENITEAIERVKQNL